MNDTPLAKLDLEQHALAECKTAMEAKQIADVAEAARVYLERTNASAETVNRATEIRLLAERQMGAFLKAMPKNQGTVPGKTGVQGKALPDDTPTLADMGVTRAKSSQAQKLADIPEPEFKERIAVAKADGGKLSTAKVIKMGRQQARNEQFGAFARGMFLARGAVAQNRQRSADVVKQRWHAFRARFYRWLSKWAERQAYIADQQATDANLKAINKRVKARA